MKWRQCDTKKFLQPLYLPLPLIQIQFNDILFYLLIIKTFFPMIYIRWADMSNITVLRDATLDELHLKLNGLLAL